MGKKILLADDSITIQKVIELTFSDEDFDVVTVGNGRLALEKVQEVRPDIVLCDIIMPEKDGYEVCDFIKKNPGLQHIPVLLLTGAFEPFDQDRAARVGSDGFLAKPFEPETLIAKVKELLGRAASRAASSSPPARPTAAPTAAIPFVSTAAREGEPSAPRPGFPASPPLTVVPPRPPEPIPFPRAAPPAPEPVKTSSSPLDAPPPSSVRFIPEEPFEDFDASSFGGEEESATPARGAEPIPFRAASDELLPMTPEESESLSVPDSASTVMFKADAVQWQVPPAPTPTAPAPAAAIPPVSAAPVAPGPPPAVPGVEPEPTVFEEVIEEDLEFGQAYVPSPTPAHGIPAPVDAAPPRSEPHRAAETVEIPPPSSNPRSAPSAPPASRPPSSRPAASMPPTPIAPSPMSAPPTASPSSAAPPVPPSPAQAPQTAAVASPWGSGRPVPPVWQSEPVSEPAASPRAAAPDPPPWAPAALPGVASPGTESFADVAAEVPVAEPSKAASQAAEVAVPVDTVEKIAQRVVAQISEKVVREIAWDVIPDLAEALIKAEIERLKAELQRI
jgi:CheY-like chemotaxis protein